MGPMGEASSQAIPRLSLEELPPDLAAALAPRVARLGYLGEFFRCAAHQPRALLSFMRFTDDLKEALPDDLTELVALTVATLLGNDYERNQHERLSRKLGFSDAWIRAASQASVGRAGALTPEQLAAQALAEAVVARQGHGVVRELDAAIRALGPERAIALLLLVGRYVTHALVVNSLALLPPVPSIFEVPA
jgi:alkylhydroperoxidase family enzyme